MKNWCSVLATAAILAGACNYAAAADDAALVHANQLLKKAILVDGHNDLPWAIRNFAAAPGSVETYDLRKPTSGETDLARLRQGGVGAQFWSVYTAGEATGNYARTQLEQIDIARRIIAKYPDDLQFALTVADVRAARKKGRIASLLGAEGGHAIEDSLGALRTFYDLGVRYMTLTHNTHTSWADSAALPPVHDGLTPFGEDVVREMNRLGMLVDLSHVSAGTMDDALRISAAPVIFSHSNARAICDVPRNVPDEILRRVKDNRGVVMVTFVAGFLDPEVAKVSREAREEYNRRVIELPGNANHEQLNKEIFGNLKMPKVTVARVADHIDYIRKIAGVQSVGLGGDFDGNDSWPEGLSDVSMYPTLFAELIRRGWTDSELTLLAGENVLRVMGEAEKVAAKLQATTAPKR